MKEINFLGLYFSPFLGVSLLALLVLWILRAVFAQTGLYRHIWHRPLFDLSLYVILVEALVLLARRLSS